jgi:hypothetical protein
MSRANGRSGGFGWAISFSPLMLVFGGLYAFILLAFGLVALNALQPPVVGWILYPLERILNALFFPLAPTHVRPNGDALGVLLMTIAVLYFPVRIARRAVLRARATRS